MELTNAFEVAVPRSVAWDILTDVERIAPCLPGAALTGTAEDGRYEGTVKVKVGPISSQYRGTARFLEQRPEDGVLVLRAEGKESRGQGNASATIEARLTAVGDDRTAVSVTTDLAITGKVAQFGRGVLADVSAGLLGQFAANLDRMISESATAGSVPQGAAGAAANGGGTSGTAGGSEDDRAPEVASPSLAGGASSAGPGTASAGTVHAPSSPAAPPADAGIDLLRVAAVPVVKRALPVLGVVLVLVLLWRRLR